MFFMNNYVYSLEGNSNGHQKKKYTCPECNHSKVFTRYLVNSSGEYLDDNVGRCDRENSCGYHYRPKEFFNDNNIHLNENYLSSSASVTEPAEPSFIEAKHFKMSLRKYDNNNFGIFLNSQVPTAAQDLLARYHVGTSSCWPASTVFWQVDSKNNVRSGKIMQYNRFTGKRVKFPESRINWMHKYLKIKDFNFKQCLFGEHLLNNDKDKTVGVVESEKTALIASAYLPMYTWVATGSVGNLNKEVCSALSGRKAVVFPDGDSYIKWGQYAKLLSGIADIKVSDLLENKLTLAEKRLGFDIADYLLRYEPLQITNEISSISY
jgi:hypothetical protein